MAELTTADVQSALMALDLDIQILSFEISTATATEAAAAIGTSLGSIVKSLCFLVDGHPALVLTAGDRRVDDRKLAAIHNVGRKKVKIADATTTIQVTGYAPGGVPPLGHVQPLTILIDESLFRFDVVYAAAGSPTSIFPIPLQTLVRITGGKLVDVTKELGG